MINQQSNLAAYLFVRGVISDDLNDGSYDSLQHANVIAAKSIICLNALITNLKSASTDLNEKEVQAIYYEAGKLEFAEDLKLWFRILYEIILKQDSGPRLGEFTALVGRQYIFDAVANRLIDPFN